MAVSVQMPALGESVTEGTVTRWLKQEGDTVTVDEPLLEVSTDKVDTEIPAPASGVLTKILAHEDDTVAVGGELAIIGEAGANIVNLKMIHRQADFFDVDFDLEVADARHLTHVAAALRACPPVETVDRTRG